MMAPDVTLAIFWFAPLLAALGSLGTMAGTAATTVGAGIGSALAGAGSALGSAGSAVGSLLGGGAAAPAAGSVAGSTFSALPAGTGALMQAAGGAGGPALAGAAAPAASSWISKLAPLMSQMGGGGGGGGGGGSGGGNPLQAMMGGGGQRQPDAREQVVNQLRQREQQAQRVVGGQEPESWMSRIQGGLTGLATGDPRAGVSVRDHTRRQNWLEAYKYLHPEQSEDIGMMEAFPSLARGGHGSGSWSMGSMGVGDGQKQAVRMNSKTGEVVEVGESYQGYKKTPRRPIMRPKMGNPEMLEEFAFNPETEAWDIPTGRTKRAPKSFGEQLMDAMAIQQGGGTEYGDPVTPTPSGGADEGPGMWERGKSWAKGLFDDDEDRAGRLDRKY